MRELDIATELENASVAMRHSAGILEASANRIDMLNRSVANEMRQEARNLRAQADLALAGVVREHERERRESAAEQMCGNYALQADAIRELLDKHAPETSGNLQTRLAQLFAAGDEAWVTRAVQLARIWSKAYDTWERDGTYRARSYEAGKRLSDALRAAREELEAHLRSPRFAAPAAAVAA